MKIDPSQHDSITATAREAGVLRTTLAAAINRGEVEYVTTPSGLVLVSIADAKRWAAEERKRGPKPEKKSQRKTRAGKKQQRSSDDS